MIYVRCMNCSYNNVAKGIRLLDKKAIFVYIGKKFMQVRAFERYIPLQIISITFTSLIIMYDSSFWIFSGASYFAIICDQVSLFIPAPSWAELDPNLLF